VESRDENDTTNLPQSIRICPLFNQQPHYRVIYPDDAACNGSMLSSTELIDWPWEMAYVTGPMLLQMLRGDANIVRNCVGGWRSNVE
jgi:hypothetical protein